MNNTDTSHDLDTCAGVRLGCVEGPAPFCSVLQLAMGRFRRQEEWMCGEKCKNLESSN